MSLQDLIILNENVERLEAELELLEGHYKRTDAALEIAVEALEYYAEPEHWTIPYIEGGISEYDRLAAKALKAIKEKVK